MVVGQNRFHLESEIWVDFDDWDCPRSWFLGAIFFWKVSEWLLNEIGCISRVKFGLILMISIAPHHDFLALMWWFAGVMVWIVSDLWYMVEVGTRDESWCLSAGVSTWHFPDSFSRHLFFSEPMSYYKVLFMRGASSSILFHGFSWLLVHLEERLSLRNSNWSHQYASITVDFVSIIRRREIQEFPLCLYLSL